MLGFAIAGVGAQFCLTRSFGLAEASLVSPILFLVPAIDCSNAFLVWGQTTEIGPGWEPLLYSLPYLDDPRRD